MLRFHAVITDKCSSRLTVTRSLQFVTFKGKTATDSVAVFGGFTGDEGYRTPDVMNAIHNFYFELVCLSLVNNEIDRLTVALRLA